MTTYEDSNDVFEVEFDHDAAQPDCEPLPVKMGECPDCGEQYNRNSPDGCLECGFGCEFPEDDEDDEPEDDGQPSEWTEWQDVFGGDDNAFDHGGDCE